MSDSKHAEGIVAAVKAAEDNSPTESHIEKSADTKSPDQKVSEKRTADKKAADKKSEDSKSPLQKAADKRPAGTRSIDKPALGDGGVAFIPDKVPFEDEAATNVEPEQVDLDLGVAPENHSDEHDEWLANVANSPTVRDDGMIKSPTAPDDGILKSPPDKTRARVEELMQNEDKEMQKRASDNVPSSQEVIRPKSEEKKA